MISMDTLLMLLDSARDVASAWMTAVRAISGFYRKVIELIIKMINLIGG